MIFGFIPFVESDLLAKERAKTNGTLMRMSMVLLSLH